MSLKYNTRLILVFSVAFSMATLGGSMAHDFQLPTIRLANANPQLCQTHGIGGACSEYWYPAGPEENTLIVRIFTDGTAELTDLQSATPSIDFPDTPLPPSSIPPEITSPNFVVTAPIPQTAYYEIQFMMANNFWGCSFNFGNSTCGMQIRQGIAHMIDKGSFTKNDLQISGVSIPIDNPVPTSSAGGLSTPNPCNYDATFPESGPQCITGAPGGTSYHLANATGTDGFPWLQAPGSPDLDAAAQHFVNAGLATGFNPATSILTGVSSAAGSHPVNFFIRNDDPVRLDLGNGLKAQICYIFTGSYTVPCQYLTVTLGPESAFPGFTTSTTSVNLSWFMYTALYTSVSAFDTSLYFTYNSRFVSGIPSIQEPSGPCSSQSVPTSSAPDYMYFCWPTYDSQSSQMEFAPSLAQSTSFGLQAEATFGLGVFTLPIFERTVQFGYPNAGWVRVVNDNIEGLPNYFTWLNAWNPAPPVAGTIRQGFAQTTRSVSPFVASTFQDTIMINYVYDTLNKANPLNPSQSIEWMSISAQQLPNSGLTYTPPTDCSVSPCRPTTQTFRFTLRNDLFFQDGRKVTSFDVAMSYLAGKGTGAFAYSGTSPMTGVTILGPSQFDINVNAVGPFTLLTLTGVPIIPGAYWSNPGSSAWTSAISTCTATNAACYPAQYTIAPLPAASTTTACALTCTFPAADMNVNVAQTAASYDPLSSHTFVGSGPFECGPVTNSGSSSGCSSSGLENPLSGGYTLTRFGSGLAPASSLSSIYFRSSGNLALCIWATFDCTPSQIVQPFLLFSEVAACYGEPVNLTGSCGHWQQGLGNPGTGSIVGLNPVSIVLRFTELNWIRPFNWQLSPPTGIAPFPPVVYEGTTTLSPSSIAGCPSGYDC